MVLIENENSETFITILAHLKNKYNFNPQKIGIDFRKAEYKAIKKIFSNIAIIPYYFQFMNNIIKLIPEKRNRNQNIKKLEYDSLS